MTAPARTANTNAVTRAEPAPVPYALKSPVAQLLSSDSARAAIMPLVPHGVDYQRVILEVYQAAARNADIMRCSPASIVLAVGKAVSTGLVIGETIHLVPFGDRLEAIRDFKGDIELVLASGAARSVTAKCIYEHETYRYTEGTTTELVHQPILDPKSRGAMIGAYAVARLPFGNVAVVQMSIDEIDAIRQKFSKQWKKGEVPDWYARKTCVHQVTKMLPKNRKLAEVLAMFEREVAPLEQAEAMDPAMEVAGSTFVQNRAAPAVDEDPFDDPFHGDAHTAPVNDSAEPTDDEAPNSVACPKCGGPMWDNRQSKKNPKAPDFKCRGRSCDGVLWPPKDGQDGLHF